MLNRGRPCVNVDKRVLVPHNIDLVGASCISKDMRKIVGEEKR